MINLEYICFKLHHGLSVVTSRWKGLVLCKAINKEPFVKNRQYQEKSVRSKIKECQVLSIQRIRSLVIMTFINTLIMNLDDIFVQWPIQINDQRFARLVALINQCCFDEHNILFYQYKNDTCNKKLCSWKWYILKCDFDKKLTVVFIKTCQNYQKPRFVQLCKAILLLLVAINTTSLSSQKHRLVREINISRAQLSLTSFFFDFVLCETKRGKKLIINLQICTS